MSSTDWSRFKVERISLPTFLKRNLIHAELLYEVARRGGQGVLEVGIGSGAQSALLSRALFTIAIDNDWRIIEAARPNLERFGPRAALLAADAFRLPFRSDSFPVSISQGLMEHFSDDGIARLLQEQLRVCRSVVFSVPSDRYPRQDVGDERLMAPSEWRAIVSRAAGPAHEVKARYYRFDLERVKYSARARQDLGGFNVLVTIDRR